jgi:hypothetical protein
MTKQEALDKTVTRFTNLLDGKVLSNAAVRTIINYYEDLQKDNTPKVSSISNIEKKFQEAEIASNQEDMEDEMGYNDHQLPQDTWDGGFVQEP